MEDWCTKIYYVTSDLTPNTIYFSKTTYTLQCGLLSQLANQSGTEIKKAWVNDVLNRGGTLKIVEVERRNDCLVTEFMKGWIHKYQNEYQYNVLNKKNSGKNRGTYTQTINHDEQINIYLLYSKHTPKICYVGKTNYPIEHRVKQHIMSACCESNKIRDNKKKNDWIFKLISENYDIEYKILEKCGFDVFGESEYGYITREKYWINYYKELGYELVNLKYY